MKLMNNLLFINEKCATWIKNTIYITYLKHINNTRNDPFFIKTEFNKFRIYRYIVCMVSRI